MYKLWKIERKLNKPEIKLYDVLQSLLFGSILSAFHLSSYLLLHQWQDFCFKEGAGSTEHRQLNKNLELNNNVSYLELCGWLPYQQLPASPIRPMMTYKSRSSQRIARNCCFRAHFVGTKITGDFIE